MRRLTTRSAEQAPLNPLAKRRRFLLRDCAVGNKTAWSADLVHDVVARIDAQRTLDAFELGAIADVDARRTDGHTRLAIDAVATVLPRLTFLVRLSTAQARR